MTFKLDPASSVGKVVLKVNDLTQMINFYQQTIGLELVKQEDKKAQFSIQGQKDILLELLALDQPAKKRTCPGLYHMAFLLPEREDLGQVLTHFQQINQPLTGAADHGYSEAIYLYDPELNGIEIYVDKDRSEWDYREDGRIEGVTEVLDLAELYSLVDGPARDYLAPGTKMGHVHLQVSDTDHSRYFFGDVLGLDLKSEFKGQALFYAAGDYHHHIGNNSWQSEGKAPAQDQDPGLAYFEMLTPNLKALIQHLDQLTYPYEQLSSNEISLKHPDLIEVHLVQI